jgi:monomeric isocitrate dehydrogenase
MDAALWFGCCVNAGDENRAAAALAAMITVRMMDFSETSGVWSVRMKVTREAISESVIYVTVRNSFVDCAFDEFRRTGM